VLSSSPQHRTKKPVELGDEPPITIGDSDPSRYTRRGVSLRWLGGALVTAATSVALMGGALFAALDGRYVVRAAAAPLDLAVQTPSRKAEKSDRVVQDQEPVAMSRVIEVSTVVRQGEQNIIAKRPYALVNASLVLDKRALGKIPPFNPRESAPEVEATSATDAIYDKAVDGEITVSVSSFPLDRMAEFDPTLELAEEDVERQILGAEFAGGSTEMSPRAEAESFVDPGSIVPSNVTVVPENVSELTKSSEVDAEEDAGTELIELVQPGDTLSKILVGSGVGEDDIAAIHTILDRLDVAQLRPGQILRVAFALDEESEETQRRPSRLSIYTRDAHVATVALTDDGRFVLGEAPAGPPPTVEDEPVVANEDSLPTIYESLYQTADDQNLPADVRDSLIATFALDVDFNGRVRPGDGLSVLYGVADGEAAAGGEILYAAITAGGVARRFYRFKSPDGSVDYYDEDGRTGDKFLMRKPMERGVFRSGFGMRTHPILRRSRMHTGVDYAAPRGTRIYAAGDGVVAQAGWKAGYGRWIAIRHANGYETGYAHQSKFADGIRPGVRVKQGQVIGYVGSTGFSTGPHLHYEVRVNGRQVNPLKIRLRRGKELSGEQLVAFQSERDRIDALVNGRPVAVASR
jgi:murein DD-endopeptidase MepM/ murein hydrolase activator NlpD